VVTLTEAIEYLIAYGQEWAFPVLFLAACLEYLFPPFPGDTVALAGAALARVADWNMFLVLVSLTVGNLVGATADYLVGRMVLGERRLENSRILKDRREGLARVMTGYRRFGPAFLALNRFLPGIRAFFFVAAGSAGIPFRWVLFYGGLSALLWNLLLLGAGFAVGGNLALLEELFRTYFHAVWLLLLLGLAVAVWRWRRRTGRQEVDDF